MINWISCVSLALLSSVLIHMTINSTDNTSKGSPPHIILILADDFGWNDVGYNNPDIKSPNIDQLSANGIRLNNSYMQFLCSPSRSAVLTGYYPFRTGMQHGVVWRHAGQGLPLQFQLLPQKLQQAGYTSHLIGKWHLGHCSKQYLPISRGFQSSLGPLAGTVRYFSHKLPDEEVLDFYNGTTPITNKDNIHSSVIYLEELYRVLSNRKPNQPLFLYLPFNLPHSPLEVEDKYLKLYEHLSLNPNRKLYSALVSTLDDNIGAIVNALKSYGIYHNSIIIFSADNGGQVNAGGNNFPLRGSKNTLYEGGVRAVGFIHSPLLKSYGYVYNGLIHAVDWFATISGLAQANVDMNVDGMDVWESIINNLPSPRTQFVYNIDNSNSSRVSAAIRDKNWKLIHGDANVPSGIYSIDNVPEQYERHTDDDWLNDTQAPWFQLYNLEDDPCELNNLAESMPDIVQELKVKLEKYISEAVKPLALKSVKFGRQLSTEQGILNTDWCTPVVNVSYSH